MAQNLGKLQSLTGGISTISQKLGPPNSFAWGRSIDFRSDSAQQTTYPKTVKISGSVVTDLPMFADIAHNATALEQNQINTLFFHGNSGNIYAVDTNDVVTKEYTVPDSSGNGIVFFSETNQVYIPTNSSITRRDMATGNYYNNFLETSGGAPTNLDALLLVAASSQSATRASTSSLQLAGNMTLEAYLKPTSLPTGTNKMSIISKWDESGSKLGYKLDIITTFNAFGSGTDSSLTISSNTTQAPIDSTCSGTAGTNTLSATNASFAAGQVVLIHQTQGTNAGQKEEGTITAYTTGTITLNDNLGGSYTTGAQVIVIPQYTNITINAGFTWTAKAWNGTTGGILVGKANGTLTNNSTGFISANICGFRQANGPTGHNAGAQGESYLGAGSVSTSANGNGGGGGQANSDNSAPGGGGGYGTTGATGPNQVGSLAGTGGSTTGATDLSTIFLGGAGGRAGATSQNNDRTPTGHGGGAIYLAAATFVNNGTITSNGGQGTVAATSNQSGSGGGSGGAIQLFCQTSSGSGSITASGGAGGVHSDSNPDGGAGGVGIVHVSYFTSNSLTSTPTLTTTQDSSLGLANGYALRLYISSDGSTFETYTQNIASFIGVYKFYSVSWQASTSTAIFYENAQAIGTKMGVKTSINQNAAIFGIGCYVNSGSTKTGFYDGLIDDVRIWSSVRTSAQIANYYNQILSGAEANLVAYYPFDGVLTDVQTSANNTLTGNNTPTYSSDVAFKGVTTRGDEDVFLNTNGNTYTLLTSLSEATANKIPFIPTKEPFKSLALNINTAGTGNWTVTVHDELNNVVATMTVLHADIQTGIFEFKFVGTERIVLNASYHIHVFDTTGDGKVVTGTASQLGTAYLKTYFQILVNDIYHQAVQFQNFACIANERYLAVLQAGNVYNPARLIFPSGYRIRSLAFWQQYLVIGMWFGNNMTDTDNGKVFFWDGQSDTYIDDLDIPQGGVNAMLGTQGGLLISAGYKGAMLEYTGYPSSFRYTARTSANLAFRLPNVAQGDTVEIAPGALTMWNAMNRIGVSLNTNSSTIHQGIYTYGQYVDNDPMSVGFDYPLSIGDNMNNTVKIGCLFTRNAKLYAGFQNSNTFGIDVVSENAAPYPTGTLEYLITDLGTVAAKKLPFIFRRDFLPLTAGQSVSLKYKPNRASNWLSLGTQNNVGATSIRGIVNQRLTEMQFAVDWVNTSKSIVFTQSTFESDDLSDERQT